MSSAVVSPSAFSIANVTVSPIKVMDGGRKSAYLNYNGQSLLLQVGSLETPFGMSTFDKDGPVKYSVDLKLRGHDDPTGNPKVAAIYNALTAIDNYMIEQGVENSKQWFKLDSKEKDPQKRKDELRNIVKAFYTPCARFSRDAEGNVKPYPPMLKVQLRHKDGKFIASKDQPLAVYDLERRPLTDVPLSDILVKGASVTMIVQCTGVWFAGSKYGVSWKAEQLRADKVPESIRGYAMVDDEEGGDSWTKVASRGSALPSRSLTGGGMQRSAAAPAAAAAAPAAPVNQFANLDADEDDEVDDEAALAPPPQAKVEEDLDDEAEDMGPIPVPVKKAMTITKKKVIAKPKA